MRLIPIEQVSYLRADAKYTAVAWAGGEALIRTTIRELAMTQGRVEIGKPVPYLRADAKYTAGRS